MKKKSVFSLLFIAMLLLGVTGCFDGETEVVTSDSGVKKVSVDVQTNAEGFTAEQYNIVGRSDEDNKPGAVKHFYVISAMTGDVIIYSTVKGKVTSSGKRLNPYTVTTLDGNSSSEYGFRIDINGERYYTPEVLQDDGTYGHSIPYLFWWDTKDVFHKHYVSGGQIIHISNAPLTVPKVMINLSE